MGVEFLDVWGPTTRPMGLPHAADDPFELSTEADPFEALSPPSPFARSPSMSPFISGDEPFLNSRQLAALLASENEIPLPRTGLDQIGLPQLGNDRSIVDTKTSQPKSYDVLRPGAAAPRGLPQMLLGDPGQSFHFEKEYYSTLTIIIAFESSASLGMGQSALGHVGIGIDDDYFDLGPSGSVYSSPAQPWWDGIIGSGKGIGDLPVVMQSADSLLKETGGVVFTADIPKEQGDGVRQYCEAIYAEMAHGDLVFSPYSGVDCTTFVAEALRGVAGIPSTGIDPWETPDEFAQRLQFYMKNTAGPNNGHWAQMRVTDSIK
jgi:hypothetical protein